MGFDSVVWAGGRVGPGACWLVRIWVVGRLGAGASSAFRCVGHWACAVWGCWDFGKDKFDPTLLNSKT